MDSSKGQNLSGPDPRSSADQPTPIRRQERGVWLHLFARRACGLPTTARVTGYALVVSDTDAAGRASYPDLLLASGLHPPTLAASLRTLETAGWLRRVRKETVAGQRGTERATVGYAWTYTVPAEFVARGAV